MDKLGDRWSSTWWPDKNQREEPGRVDFMLRIWDESMAQCGWELRFMRISDNGSVFAEFESVRETVCADA